MWESIVFDGVGNVLVEEESQRRRRNYATERRKEALRSRIADYGNTRVQREGTKEHVQSSILRDCRFLLRIFKFQDFSCSESIDAPCRSRKDPLVATFVAPHPSPPRTPRAGLATAFAPPRKTPVVKEPVLKKAGRATSEASGGYRFSFPLAQNFWPTGQKIPPPPGPP